MFSYALVVVEDTTGSAHWVKDPVEYDLGWMFCNIFEYELGCIFYNILENDLGRIFVNILEYDLVRIS